MQDWSIDTKEKLNSCLEEDRKANLKNKKITMELKFRSSFPYTAYKYLTVLRKQEYACSRRDNASGWKAKLFAQQVKILDRKRNRLGLKAGLDIPINRVQPGVRIAHPNVILNGYVGEGCIFHGNNVLGNKQTGAADAVPKLGKNVDVGVFAMVIGDVEIADDCIIGAGAVVTKSFTVPGSVIAGVPAKLVRSK